MKDLTNTFIRPTGNPKQEQEIMKAQFIRVNGRDLNVSHIRSIDAEPFDGIQSLFIMRDNEHYHSHVPAEEFAKIGIKPLPANWPDCDYLDQYL